LRSRIANGYEYGHPKFYVTHNGNGYGHPDFFIRRTRTRSRFHVCGHEHGHVSLSVLSPTWALTPSENYKNTLVKQFCQIVFVILMTTIVIK
jgi:hypothetical protein